MMESVLITALVTATIGFLVNKFLNQCEKRMHLHHELQTNTDADEMKQQIEDQRKQIVDLHIALQQIKEEMAALKLNMGLRGNRQ